MENPQANFCDACHTRPSVYHTTSIIDFVARESHLCRDCFETVGETAAREFVASSRDARCQYCGAVAHSSRSDVLAQVLDEAAHVRSMCFECSQEYHQFNLREIQNLPQDLSSEQQLEALRRLRDAVQNHMKVWVRTNRLQ